MATRYLKKRGYHIIARNYYTRYGELDIICSKGGALIFVEVKTRRGTGFGTPEEAITPRKIEHLRKAAAIYLETDQPSFKEIRFDVIALLIVENKADINHIKYAF